MAGSRQLLMKILEEKLIQKRAILEKTVKENDALILARRNDLAARCEKMKQMKRENNALRKGNQEMKETLIDLTKTENELADYIELLRSDTDGLIKEVEDYEKHQNQQLEDIKQKWKEYEAQYETLPLAIVRRKEKISLQKSKIELLVKQQKLADLKKVIRIRKEIDSKLRNSLVVGIVKVCKEIKLEEIENRAVLSDRTRLEEELRQQSITISELKEKKRSADQQQKLLGKSGENRPISSSLITLSQDRSRYQIPEVHHLDSVCLLTTPSFRKDSDSISITSSVIDSLIEGAKHQTEPTNDPDQSPLVNSQEKDQMTEAVRVPEEVDTANPEEEEEYRSPRAKDLSSKNVRSIGNPIITDRSEKSFDVEMMESEAFDVAQGYEYSDENREEELPNALANRDYYVPTAEKRPDSVDDEPIRGEGQRRLLNFGEPEAKVPRISSIQKVKMNIPTGNQDIEDDPLKHYLAASESDASLNWIPGRRVSSIFSNNAPDYQRGIIDTEVQSSIGSETSMQFEDMMKECRAQFSPIQRRGSRGDERRTNLREADDQTQRQHEPQAGPLSQTNQPIFPAIVPFLAGFRKSGAPTDSKGPKKDPFFLSMF